MTALSGLADPKVPSRIGSAVTSMSWKSTTARLQEQRYNASTTLAPTESASRDGGPGVPRHLAGAPPKLLCLGGDFLRRVCWSVGVDTCESLIGVPRSSLRLARAGQSMDKRVRQCL